MPAAVGLDFSDDEPFVVLTHVEGEMSVEDEMGALYGVVGA